MWSVLPVKSQGENGPLQGRTSQVAGVLQAGDLRTGRTGVRRADISGGERTTSGENPSSGRRLAGWMSENHPHVCQESRLAPEMSLGGTHGRTTSAAPEPAAGRATGTSSTAGRGAVRRSHRVVALGKVQVPDVLDCQDFPARLEAADRSACGEVAARKDSSRGRAR
jgi:hypothetical protein